MNIYITKSIVRRKLNNRIQLDGKGIKIDQIIKWLSEYKIKHYRVNEYIFYLDAKDATFFILRWS